MKLALVISSLGAGGSENVLSVLATKLSARGHKVTILTDASPALDHYKLDPGISRVALHLQSDSTRLSHRVFRNVFRVMRLRSEISSITPQVVLAFGDTVNVRVLLACIGLGLPVVVSERVDPREHLIPWPWRALRRLLYPLAECVVVQTESVARWAVKCTTARRVRVVPNPLRRRSTLMPRQNALDARKTIISVGRLTVQKGFDLLLNAFALTNLQHNGWQVLILGEGPERSALQAQVNRLGLQKFVLMPGVVLEPGHWLQHGDLFVLSSRFEGFPNALLEAMQCGLPSIAFNCPSGPGEIIRDEQTGLLVQAGDVDKLSAAIKRLAEDPDLRRRLGAAARHDVERRFDPDQITTLWEDVLFRRLDERTRA